MSSEKILETSVKIKDLLLPYPQHTAGIILEIAHKLFMADYGVKTAVEQIEQAKKTTEAGAQPVEAVPVPVEPKKETRGRKPKAEIIPPVQEDKNGLSKETSQETFEDFEETSQEKEVELKPLTVDDVRKACVEVAQKEGKEYVLGILKNFGALKVQDLKPIDYKDFVEAIYL